MNLLLLLLLGLRTIAFLSNLCLTVKETGQSNRCIVKVAWTEENNKPRDQYVTGELGIHRTADGIPAPDSRSHVLFSVSILFTKAKRNFEVLLTAVATLSYGNGRIRSLAKEAVVKVGGTSRLLVHPSKEGFPEFALHVILDQKNQENGERMMFSASVGLWEWRPRVHVKREPKRDWTSTRELGMITLEDN